MGIGTPKVRESSRHTQELKRKDRGCATCDIQAKVLATDRDELYTAREGAMTLEHAEVLRPTGYTCYYQIGKRVEGVLSTRKRVEQVSEMIRRQERTEGNKGEKNRINPE